MRLLVGFGCRCSCGGRGFLLSCGSLRGKRGGLLMLVDRWGRSVGDSIQELHW